MKHDRARLITGSSSIFLDSLRICAALTVFYIHASNLWFPASTHQQNKPGDLSHAAVVVFFVLSGYVIAHTTISKNRGGVQYAQARLTRLSSVVIPALLVTLIIQCVIRYLSPATLLTYSRSFSGIRYVASGFFINEVWFFSAAPPLNISLWSLSFEFWYYTIFGLWFYRKPGWKSLVICLAACLFAGPKILIMMPIWLFGYMAYRLPQPQLKPATRWVLVLLVLTVAGFGIAFLPFMPYIVGYRPLYYANQFVTDWMIGLFVAIALWVLPVGRSSRFTIKLSPVFRNIADLTFPLYVLHYPILILWRCLFCCKTGDSLQLWVAIISILIISGMIGIVLEKQRFLWSGFFKWLLKTIRNIFFKPEGKIAD